jgi:hypothetical protein
MAIGTLSTKNGSATVSESRTGKPLADDLLIGAEGIGKYTGEDTRRTRHLIKAHGLPHFKRGGRIYSRKSWVDAYYNGGAG